MSIVNNNIVPKFSIILVVSDLDLPSYLDECLLSLQNQTLLPDQFILVYNGKIKDLLKNILNKYNRIFQYESIYLDSLEYFSNALNHGIKILSNDLFIRVDPDDINHPERFAIQVDFMHRNPDISFSSSYIEKFSSTNSSIKKVIKLPCNHLDLLEFTKKGRCPLAHPAVIMRTQAVRNIGGYSNFHKCQDLALWSVAMLKGYKFANLDKVLVKMRVGDYICSKRDLTFFKSEVKVLLFQYSIGFLNLKRLLQNLSFRFSRQVIPNWLSNILYKYI
jgi:GT2 family glycosyltransferase